MIEPIGWLRPQGASKPWPAARWRTITTPRPGLSRLLALGILGGILVYGLIRFWIFLQPGSVIASDHDFVMAQAARILAGGPVYQTWELTNPIYPQTWADLYPPTTVFLLFIPMSLLPAILWWAIPLGTIGAVVWRYRPSLWGWTAIAALALLWPHTWAVVQLGNPAMWIAMFVALGTTSRWPAALVFLKPTLAPFALIGVRSKWWWVAIVELGLVSLVTIPAWVDYARVLDNLTGFDWTYSFNHVGIVLIPVAARLSSRRFAR
jgi:hypothetical protein